MAPLNENDFNDWFDENKDGLAELFKKEKGNNAIPYNEKQRTKIDSHIVHMVDPSDQTKILETLLVAVSYEPITDYKGSVPEEHLILVSKASGKIPVSELLIQIDENKTIVNHNLRSIPKVDIEYN